jgi:hypothetical protein
MATLTEVSFYTRRLVIGVLVLFVVILLSPLLLGAARMIYLAVLPPEPEAVNQKYGQLPELVFPKVGEAYKPTYKLETKDGSWPVVDKVGKVFWVQTNNNRLLELERMRARARTLDLGNEPKKIDDHTYVFAHASLPIEMAVDLIYGNYGYKYKWLGDAEFLKGKDIPGKDEALAAAKSFFSSLQLLTSELANGRATYTYLAASQDGQLKTVNSLSEGNFVRVDLFRLDIDKLKVVTTGWSASPVNVIFSGYKQDRNKKIAGANYNFSTIDVNNFGTYVLKSSKQAWEDLLAGRGYVPKKSGASVVVRQIYLAYYESDQPQQFMQPVFVFEGDEGFVGYVSAVDPSFPERPSRN